MIIRTLQRSLVLLVALALTVPVMAQVTLKGRVLDAKTKEALTGAVVVNTKTNGVAVAKHDGTFQMAGAYGDQELQVSFLGYKDLTIATNSTGEAVDLGDILMQVDAFGVEEVVVTAGIVIKDRATPVAVSNITLEQIETKLSNQEFPEILKSTPSVYATKESGGYGDSRVNIRGFDSSNIGVLINGVPVNGMENGKVYWSNWAGLSDVTSFMQVQRGLGASKLGLSSVGGTINIITRSTDAIAGGSVYYGIGNDGLRKFNINVSTGLMENGWALTLAGGRAAADGYVMGTDYEAWNYFVNISKQLCGGRHRLSFTAFGAPQWHNQRGNMYTIEDYRTNQDFRRMNRSFGYFNGEVVGGDYGRNEYHKPQISLVHYWTIDSKSALSTSVYASSSTGGRRRTFGPNARALSVNGGTNGDGHYYPETMQTPDGRLDYNAVYEQNRASLTGSQTIFGLESNAHQWYGILSSYNNQITDHIKVTGGFDGRYYTGDHVREITDLLGGEYYFDATWNKDEKKYEPKIYGRPANTPLHKGDIIEYDEMGEVLWTGVFAQAEYEKGPFSAFLSGSLSGNFYRQHNTGEAPVNTDGKYRQVSKWVNFLPYSVKAGANYKFLDHHNVFVNGGYFTRAPFFNTTFVDFTVVTNPDAKMERITTAEVGYGFSNNYLNITLDGYYTLWLDKGVTRRFAQEIYNIPGLNARHMGLELEATYRPSSNFNIRAMGSVGDWIWRDDVDFVAYNDQQQQVGAFKAFLAGVHVGNSAQITAALGVNWSPFKNFRVSADFNWFGKNFADFEPTNRTQIQDKVDSWQMPDYYTIDVGANYKFKMGNTRATLFGNVNNLFDAEYFADAKDGLNHNASTALVYYGFGRTWSAGLKISF